MLECSTITLVIQRSGDKLLSTSRHKMHDDNNYNDENDDDTNKMNQSLKTLFIDAHPQLNIMNISLIIY